MTPLTRSRSRLIWTQTCSELQRSDHGGTFVPQGGDDGTGQRQLVVNAGRLWAGGLATAAVAALVAVVGVLIATVARSARLTQIRR